MQTLLARTDGTAEFDGTVAAKAPGRTARARPLGEQHGHRGHQRRERDYRWRRRPDVRQFRAPQCKRRSDGRLRSERDFNSTVNSQAAQAWALTVNTAGNEVFNGIVGGRQALGSLATDANGIVGGETIFNAAGTVCTAPTVTTTRAPRVIMMPRCSDKNTTLTSLSGGTIGFDGGGSYCGRKRGTEHLLARTDGTTEFDGAVGGSTPLGGLHVQGYSASILGVTDINGESVTTAGTGGQIYDNAVVLSTDATITDQAGQGITFNSAVNSQTGGNSSITLS